MVDPIDFERTVARFGVTDTGCIVDVLRGAYKILEVGERNVDDGMSLLIGDFIAALEDCDCIEIVQDEEMLIDEG